jgi:DNA replication protein DnaC
MEHIGKVFQQDQKMAERTAAIETRRREYEGILRRQRAEELFKASGCPERQANIGKIDPGSKWQASLELLSGQLRFANGFIVAILGQRGTGKTQLAIALVRRACAAQLRCRYIKASDLFRSIRSTYGRSDKQETEEEVFNRWVSYDLLVIDESHERGETPE